MKAELATGSWKNKSAQASKYIQFMNIFTPIQYEVMVIGLSDYLTSLTSVLNYASGACTYVMTFGGEPKGFDTYPVTLVRKGIQ